MKQKVLEGRNVAIEKEKEIDACLRYYRSNDSLSKVRLDRS